MGDYSTNAIQEGDVQMFMVDDRGDIEEKDGFITMTTSLETAGLMTHLGGNDDDDGTESTEKNQWWGNEDEPAERQHRPRLQNMLASGVPLTSSSVVTIAEAALEDIDRDFVSTGLAKYAEVTNIDLVSPKRVEIQEKLTLEDESVIPIKVN